MYPACPLQGCCGKQHLAKSDACMKAALQAGSTSDLQALAMPTTVARNTAEALLCRFSDQKRQKIHHSNPRLRRALLQADSGRRPLTKSMGRPEFNVKVHVRPPARSLASNTSTFLPAASKAWPAASPLAPAPTMIASNCASAPNISNSTAVATPNSLPGIIVVSHTPLVGEMYACVVADQLCKSNRRYCFLTGHGLLRSGSSGEQGCGAG
jgi:hypothetical protein